MIITEISYFLFIIKDISVTMLHMYIKFLAKKKKDVFLLHSQRGWILSECCKVSFSAFSDITKMIIKHSFINVNILALYHSFNCGENKF